MIYAILIGYIALTFWSSLFGAKIKNATPESYFMADRKLGVVALFFTILATNFSAFYFLGFAGEAYTVGFPHYIMMAVGTSFAGLSFLIIGTKVWQLGKANGYITPAELIYGQTKSRPLAYMFSAVMMFFTLPYLALQIIGGGYILENLTNGEISYALGVVILTLVTIVYVVLGGMASVAKTDVKQGILMISFMLFAVVFVAHDLGGITAANSQAMALVPELFLLDGEGAHYTPLSWISFLVFWFFCVPMFPQLFMRFYIAKDIKILKKSALLYAGIPIFISILPVFIGVWGHISFPGLQGKAADQILPMMLMEHTTDWFAALVMTGAIAAFMSTLDSQLLALSTMFNRDFYLPMSGKTWNFKQEVLAGRFMVGVFAVIGLIIAFNPFDTIFDMGKMAFSGLAILFPVALAVTRYRLVRPWCAMLGIALSLMLLFAFHYGFISTSVAMGFEPFILLIALSFCFTFLGVTFKRESSSTLS